MAYHCYEPPFVFNNIYLSEKITCGGERAQALADKVNTQQTDYISSVPQEYFRTEDMLACET